MWELLWTIPNTLINVIRKLYNTCTIQLNLGVKLEAISYEPGVQQGDNMTPICFIFIMQAIKHTVESTLPTSKPEFIYFLNNKDHLLGQRTKSAGTPFPVHSLLFRDDGAFLLQTCNRTYRGEHLMGWHTIWCQNHLTACGTLYTWCVMMCTSV